jgi:arginine decarboxylase
LARGDQVVSATFVTPYPPGYPVLVPGQCFSNEIMEFMSDLDTPEVHGYRPELGYRVFTDAALRQDESAAAQAPPERRKSGRRKRSAGQH